MQFTSPDSSFDMNLRSLQQGVGGICREFYDCAGNLNCCPTTKMCATHCPQTVVVNNPHMQQQMQAMMIQMMAHMHAHMSKEDMQKNMMAMMDKMNKDQMMMMYTMMSNMSQADMQKMHPNMNMADILKCRDMMLMHMQQRMAMMGNMPVLYSHGMGYNAMHGSNMNNMMHSTHYQYQVPQAQQQAKSVEKNNDLTDTEIAGIVIGSVVGALLLLCFLCFCCNMMMGRRRGCWRCNYCSSGCQACCRPGCYMCNYCPTGCQQCCMQGCPMCNNCPTGCQQCCKRGCPMCNHSMKGCNNCCRKGCNRCSGQGCQNCPQMNTTNDNLNQSQVDVLEMAAQK